MLGISAICKAESTAISTWLSSTPRALTLRSNLSALLPVSKRMVLPLQWTRAEKPQSRIVPRF